MVEVTEATLTLTRGRQNEHRSTEVGRDSWLTTIQPIALRSDFFGHDDFCGEIGALRLNSKSLVGDN